jgi:hypothetical protein
MSIFRIGHSRIDGCDFGLTKGDQKGTIVAIFHPAAKLVPLGFLFCHSVFGLAGVARHRWVAERCSVPVFSIA